ncbi:hypothetical protein K431DRAFT_316794 [Polychaeton citri CBS 116435]|uniref:Histidine kinase n=1 Tax=Polychaeton citri CBS 116435 TaxID=1314669 RepID=A0A9P4Q0Y9_9PEZI|nr:hypothetical protein K431DRAFT_316794 [Polychaeton citri CBS 116435]
MSDANKPSIFTSRDSLKRKRPSASPHTDNGTGNLQAKSVLTNAAPVGTPEDQQRRAISTRDWAESQQANKQELDHKQRQPEGQGNGDVGERGNSASRARSALQAAAEIFDNRNSKGDQPPSPSAARAEGVKAAVKSPPLKDSGGLKHSLLHRRSSVSSQTRSISIGPGTFESSQLHTFRTPPIPSFDRSRKRPANAQATSPGERISEPARKKIRQKHKHTLGGLSYLHQPSQGFAAPREPPSPLFFSHSPKPRPRLPPRFSSSEAAAKMLSSARAEDSHVKTVSLARGLVSAASSTSIPTSAPRDSMHHRQSLDRSSTGRSASPDTGSSREIQESSTSSRDPMAHVLNSIGIIELLEQDERPTFVVDLGDPSNYGSGPINPIFMNAALRSYGGMPDLVTGIMSDSSGEIGGGNRHLQFKSWLLSAAINGESLSVCLPAFSYVNTTWTCSTLRKRLRIISGAFNPQISAANGVDAIAITTPADVPRLPAQLTVPPTVPALAVEAAPSDVSDYFGPSAASPKAPDAPMTSPPSAEAVSADVFPTIEAAVSLDAKTPSSKLTPGSVSSVLPLALGDGASLDQHYGSKPDLSSSIALLHNPSMYVEQSTSPIAQVHNEGNTPFGKQEDGANTNTFHDHSQHDETSTNEDDSTIPIVPSDAPSFDWTRLPITDAMPPHIRFARSVDWAVTSLGPIETWSADLRQMCNLIMASPHPAAMYWGDDLIAIYNEAYIFLAGQKHPRLMGQSYRAAWAEIWDDVKDVFDSAKLTGEATMKDDDCLFIKRTDSLEETYFSWSIIPMVGSDGSVMGLYNPAFEKTRRKIAERRMLTLREVGERTASARDVKAFWREVLNSWDVNESDSPFLLLYSVSDEGDSDTSSIHSSSVLGTRLCLLEGSLGVPPDHPAAPSQIDLRSGMEGFGPVFRETIKTDKPLLLEVGSKDLPESLLHGLELRGFGDPVKAVVICPIHPTTGESILGFLVVGVNPRRPYDDDYSLFVQLLSRQLATSLASVVLFEEEIRRGQRAAKLAALDRIELSQQLAARTREAIESETKFTRMAEFAPVGMFITGSDGRITFANDTWYEVSHVPKNKDMADTWMDSVHPEDLDLVKGLWHQLVVDTKPVSSEFRFRAEWLDRNGVQSDRWVLFSAFPERYSISDSDRIDGFGSRTSDITPAGSRSNSTSTGGSLKSIFGVITNISQQKWAEGLQRRRMEEAMELKRQQENFIDITSHEMRNPLSAILQCADEITQTMMKLRTIQENGSESSRAGSEDSDARSNGTSPPLLTSEVIANCLDAAQTINLCSQHQKRIVDDILTLSKLDSQLLLVTPVDAQPLTVVQRALKMHEGELQAADIQMRFVVDQSFRDLDLDWVRFDPSRVLQVLINLTTNAIKFTTTESRRTITVTIAASLERPSKSKNAPVNYFLTRNMKKDISADKEWGDGEKVYIHFAVRDTGRGLNPEEKKLLFLRFSQASPRTHVQYGGSGLGLFISRELTELQGGEIGVESEAGKGSTFAFYVAARRSSPPENDIGIGLTIPSVAKHQRAPSDAAGKKDALARAHSSGVTPTLKNGTKPAKPLARKVLIVEDNLVNQRVLQKQLKNMGTEVHVANHGGEALEKLRQSSFWGEPIEGGATPIDLRCILMDQEMPVMDGLTCTRKIRELEREGKLKGHVPIIAVTANARSEQVQTALDAGMDDIICKPFKIPELVPKIDELMAKYPVPE